MIEKIKIQYVGVNSSGYDCYITQKGSYIAKIGEDLYSLNQYPDLGFVGMEGEPCDKLKKDCFEIVVSFTPEEARAILDPNYKED